MTSKHHIILAYSPSVNGVIERMHRSLGAFIRSFCEEKTLDWLPYIPALKFSLRTVVRGNFNIHGTKNFRDAVFHQK